jgi:hypothetical protein
LLEEATEYEPFEKDAAMPEADDYTPEAYDKYLTAEVKLANMGTLQKGTVMRRKRDADGNPVGQSHHLSDRLQAISQIITHHSRY